MNRHEIMGAIKSSAGTVEEGFGALTEDREVEARGQARQLTGRIERLMGKAIDEAQALYRAHPLASLMALGALAIVIVPSVKGR